MVRCANGLGGGLKISGRYPHSINPSGELFFTFMNKGNEEDITKNVVRRLQEHGVEEGDEYSVEFAFMGDSAKLLRLEKYLNERGFRFDKSQTDKMLIAVRNVTMSMSNLLLAISEMKQIADEYGVTYDGWSLSL